mmetsp:Transcript_30810/g.89539  ORF Transcript_30810/g.89539 Transcript_30810/m.89539 type:complete len:266 (-) Transcript_30810:156-953(-)
MRSAKTVPSKSDKSFKALRSMFKWGCNPCMSTTNATVPMSPASLHAASKVIKNWSRTRRTDSVWFRAHMYTIGWPSMSRPNIRMSQRSSQCIVLKSCAYWARISNAWRNIWTAFCASPMFALSMRLAVGKFAHSSSASASRRSLSIRWHHSSRAVLSTACAAMRSVHSLVARSLQHPPGRPSSLEKSPSSWGRRQAPDALRRARGSSCGGGNCIPNSAASSASDSTQSKKRSSSSAERLSAPPSSPTFGSTAMAGTTAPQPLVRS